MSSNIAPDLTPFVVAFVLVDLLAVLALVGVATVPHRVLRAATVPSGPRATSACCRTTGTLATGH